jgi:6-pyruvoyltetrahydropterin/6-carboxytetrahydropterin synthase
VRLTRRVTFSSGHRYWIPALSEGENRALFGQWANPFNHGHNYVLEVTTEGVIHPENGMVVNIKTIDDILKRDIVSQFDQRSINDQIPHFQSRASSLENILLYIRDQLGNLPTEARLAHLKLEEMPTLWAELDLTTNPEIMTLTRTYEFAASHRLHNPILSETENDELYGKCNNPAGHGHNYILEVTVQGKPDPKTGFLCDLAALDEAVNEKVVDRYDHKNFNVDLPEFKGRMTTSEIVAQEIWERLDGQLPATLSRVRLHETARNIFEVSRGT